MTLMVTSQNGLDLIKNYEGCKLLAYRDAIGVPTIGYGHTKNVKLGTTITQRQAEDFLREDITPIESLLNGLKINFKQQQFDALVSWIFNLGEGCFQSSTLKKKILANALDNEITDQIVRWVNAGGKPLLGLKRRRVAEANMWLGKEMYKVDAQGVIRK